MGVQGRTSCGGVFFGRECCVQLRKFIFPVVFCFIKGVCQTAPAHIFGENNLFFGCCLSAVKLQFFQKIDGVHIHTELCFCTTFTQMVIGNAKIVKFGLLHQRLWGFDRSDFHIERKIVFFRRVKRCGF